MQITVQVVSVEHNIEIQKKSGGVYPGTRLTYRLDGKIQEQNFHNNSLKYNPNVAESLKVLVSGDVVTIDKIKDGEFWKVTAITKGGSVPQPSTPATPTPAASKGTWETAEERAKKQVMIVRQSSISAAINMFQHKSYDKISIVEADIVKVAKFFEAYVLDIEFDDGSVESMSDSEID